MILSRCVWLLGPPIHHEFQSVGHADKKQLDRRRPAAKSNSSGVIRFPRVWFWGESADPQIDVFQMGTGSRQGCLGSALESLEAQFLVVSLGV